MNQINKEKRRKQDEKTVDNKNIIGKKNIYTCGFIIVDSLAEQV